MSKLNIWIVFIKKIICYKGCQKCLPELTLCSLEKRRQILYYSVHILRKDYLKIHKTSIWRGSNIWYKPVHKLSGLFTEIGYSAKAAVGR